MTQNKQNSNRVPPRRACGAMEVHHRLLERHPDFRTRQGDLEHAFLARSRTAHVARAVPYSVKVVVHIVLNDPQQVSDAQVQSQIDALNRDYRKKNPDAANTPDVWKGLAGDASIQFALATIDPLRQATTGITRTATNQPDFGNDDSVKATASGGITPWPTDRYLNIWVCNLSDNLLGYAQFPGGPPQTDGVVILHTAFGTMGTAQAPFNVGRTATHEVGHFFNLRHIWGDTEDCTGSDFVDDTPNAQHPNYGKPQYPHVSCSNGPDGDMFMNYMDYVDDDTMVMFTRGQALRMDTTLAGPRASLVGP